MDIEEQLNLNGEFLGVTSMAAYSAPWFLQVPLLVLVGLLFYVKIAHESKDFRTKLQAMGADEEGDELLALLNRFNRWFFGFTVAKKNMYVYWLGFLIYLITFVYASALAITHLV